MASLSSGLVVVNVEFQEKEGKMGRTDQYYDPSFTRFVPQCCLESRK